MLANIFATYHFSQATNLGVNHYYAALYNNSIEMNHRAELNHALRLKLFRA